MFTCISVYLIIGKVSRETCRSFKPFAGDWEIRTSGILQQSDARRRGSIGAELRPCGSTTLNLLGDSKPRCSGHTPTGHVSTSLILSSSAHSLVFMQLMFLDVLFGVLLRSGGQSAYSDSVEGMSLLGYLPFLPRFICFIPSPWIST